MPGDRMAAGGTTVRDKRTTLAEAMAAVPDGAVLALGGNTLHRAPCAAVHELVRQGRRGLVLVKTAGAYDVDLLCAAGSVGAVAAGFVGYETPFGMAPAYRRAVEAGAVEAREHVCASVIAGLRAAIQGVPFMPMAGMAGSDLPAARGFRFVPNPYGEGEVVAIPAIAPDVAVIHVQAADGQGNAQIVGTRFEDPLMAQAARRVVVTAERIVDRIEPEQVAIPGLYVDAVVLAREGAHPCGCAGAYGYDGDWLAAWTAAAKTAEGARRFIEERILGTPGAMPERAIDGAVRGASAEGGTGRLPSSGAVPNEVEGGRRARRDADDAIAQHEERAGVGSAQ